MKAEEALSQRYQCPKCHNRECHVHHVRVPMDVLPLPVGRYLVTTCTLCGYTEFYDQAVFESLRQHERLSTTSLSGDYSVDA